MNEGADSQTKPAPFFERVETATPAVGSLNSCNSCLIRLKIHSRAKFSKLEKISAQDKI